MGQGHRGKGKAEGQKGHWKNGTQANAQGQRFGRVQGQGHRGESTGVSALVHEQLGKGTLTKAQWQGHMGKSLEVRV